MLPMSENGNSDNQSSSNLLDSLGKLSLSTNCDTGDQLIGPFRNETSTTPLPPCDAYSSDQLKDGNENETAQQTGIAENFPSFRLPFPREPIIDVMNFKDCNLDRTFSIVTDLGRPKRLGYFSCQIAADGKTQSYHPDKSASRYLHHFHRNKINMDLLVGFHPEKTWGRVPPGEMHILRWFSDNFYDCIHQEDDEEKKEEDDTIDFICYTRMLRTVMNAPYNNRQDWICIAIKVRGSIILDEIDTPLRQVSTDGQTNRQKATSYAGYKFEESITRRYDGAHRPTHDEGKRDSFYIVSKVKLNKHTILYCNRVDCALNKDQLDKPVDEMEFAQIKTRSANYYTVHQAKTFFWRKRVISWWIESVLANINQIVCGDKDDNLYIRKISRLQVNSLPKERNVWSPRTCVSFLDIVLSFIKSVVTDELTPYRFYCVPGKAIVCQKMNEPVENYLPSWFINDEEPSD